MCLKKEKKEDKLKNMLKLLQEIQDTKGLRYKKEAAAQNTPPFENDKDGLLPEFPHIVSIVPERGRTLCLGVLISVSFVLAPGNCLSSQK